MLMQQAKKLIGFVFWQFLPVAWSLACFLNIPLALLDRICLWQLLPEAWNLAGQIFRLQATCHRQNFGSFNSWFVILIANQIVIEKKQYKTSLNFVNLAFTFLLKKLFKKLLRFPRFINKGFSECSIFTFPLMRLFEKFLAFSFLFTT